uniref:Radixin n=1 Tax=Schistocephalus solidus TaxID=70667 RepID=A0A0X3Q2N4_SCHSO
MNSHDAKRMAGNEDLIKRLFNKVYSAIIQEEIFCPPETAVILAAYACQAKFGDAYDVNDPIPPVKELLPKSIIDNHTLSIHDWETRISRWHLKLHDVSFLDSIVEYLDIAQDVELYGASIFEVETKSGSRKWISLDAVGLNIYESKRKPPTKRYLWADIKSFEARENRLEIVLTHSPDHLTEFYVKNHYATDLLVNLYRGSKELYGRRKVVVGGSKYLRRSESNSSMRLRPHKLTKEELAEIERLLTELELELPHRATGFEYAPWQVKDHQRQAKALEVKLNLSIPSTEETRKMLRRVADIIVFLGQDFFNAKEDDIDRPHRYRGNFAIRIGGPASSRMDGYTSDVDSGTTCFSGFREWQTSSQKPKIAGTSPISWPGRSPDSKKVESHFEGPQQSEISRVVEKTKESEFTAPPAPTPESVPEFEASMSPRRKLQDPSLSTTPISPTTMETFPAATADTANGEETPMPPTWTTDEETPVPPSQWPHSLKPATQDFRSSYSSGRKHGQILSKDESMPLPYRPPVQPKPKVQPRSVAAPQTVQPYAENTDFADRRNDLKFSSINKIQKGLTKKRVDLFEAL